MYILTQTKTKQRTKNKKQKQKQKQKKPISKKLVLFGSLMRQFQAVLLIQQYTTT